MSQPAIAVLCSGQGTNLQAIINALRARRLRARLAVVIADRRNAVALVRAKRAGLATAFVNPRDFSTREGFDRRLIEILDQHRAQLVCLAGFMRIRSEEHTSE